MNLRAIAFALALWLPAAVAFPADDPTPSLQGRFDLREVGSGRRATRESYRGSLRLVFFGFTHCPLTCPTSLHTMVEALAKIGPDAAQVKPLFITLDPERDTAAVMKAYLASFDPRLIGLRGSRHATEAAMREFRLEAERVGTGKDYGFEHPAMVYLMDREGGFVQALSSNGTANEIAAAVKEALKP